MTAPAVPIKIMLVDDNRTFVAAVRGVLDSLAGAQVVAQAHDGEEALALALQCQPDLVLLDITMPRMNGLEVARSLQSRPQAPRIVFLSMHNGTSYREAARAMGAAAFVDKADFVIELLPIIERLIAERAGEGPGNQARPSLEV
jgi:DNA-binding NarL/FixJ family response regulator